MFNNIIVIGIHLNIKCLTILPRPTAKHSVYNDLCIHVWLLGDKIV